MAASRFIFIPPWNEAYIDTDVFLVKGETARWRLTERGVVADEINTCCTVDLCGIASEHDPEAMASVVYAAFGLNFRLWRPSGSAGTP
jgi:hypothetical protein